jgi:glycerophosphoryl diester phosphodiesterase
MSQETLVVYHRCGGKTLGYPPNTILTAEWARDYGAKAIEYDVAIAKDGDNFKVFVIEPKLLSDAGLNINQLEWSDVQKLNAGNEQFGRQPVPLLEDMLDAIKSEQVAHQIQIKGQHPATVKKVLAVAKNAQDYIITAFDRNVIREIKSLDKDVKVGWLVKPDQGGGDEGGVDLTAKLVAEADSLEGYAEDEITAILDIAKEDSVNTILLCGPRIKDRALVERVKDQGFEIGAWGVASDIKLAKQLIGLELNRFTLDNPEQLN